MLHFPSCFNGTPVFSLTAFSDHASVVCLPQRSQALWSFRSITLILQHLVSLVSSRPFTHSAVSSISVSMIWLCFGYLLPFCLKNCPHMSPFLRFVFFLDLNPETFVVFPLQSLLSSFCFEIICLFFSLFPFFAGPSRTFSLPLLKSLSIQRGQGHSSFPCHSHK